MEQAIGTDKTIGNDGGNGDEGVDVSDGSKKQVIFIGSKTKSCGGDNGNTVSISADGNTNRSDDDATCQVPSRDQNPKQDEHIDYQQDRRADARRSTLTQAARIENSAPESSIRNASTGNNNNNNSPATREHQRADVFEHVSYKKAGWRSEIRTVSSEVEKPTSDERKNDLGKTEKEEASETRRQQQKGNGLQKQRQSAKQQQPQKKQDSVVADPLGAHSQNPDKISGANAAVAPESLDARKLLSVQLKQQQQLDQQNLLTQQNTDECIEPEHYLLQHSPDQRHLQVRKEMTQQTSREKTISGTEQKQQLIQQQVLEKQQHRVQQQLQDRSLKSEKQQQKLPVKKFSPTRKMEQPVKFCHESEIRHQERSPTVDDGTFNQPGETSRNKEQQRKERFNQCRDEMDKYEHCKPKPDKERMPHHEGYRKKENHLVAQESVHHKQKPMALQHEEQQQFQHQQQKHQVQKMRQLEHAEERQSHLKDDSSHILRIAGSPQKLDGSTGAAQKTEQDVDIHDRTTDQTELLQTGTDFEHGSTSDENCKSGLQLQRHPNHQTTTSTCSKSTTHSGKNEMAKEFEESVEELVASRPIRMNEHAPEEEGLERPTSVPEANWSEDCCSPAHSGGHDPNFRQQAGAPLPSPLAGQLHEPLLSLHQNKQQNIRDAEQVLLLEEQRQTRLEQQKGEKISSHTESDQRRLHQAKLEREPHHHQQYDSHEQKQQLAHQQQVHQHQLSHQHHHSREDNKDPQFMLHERKKSVDVKGDSKPAQEQLVQVGSGPQQIKIVQQEEAFRKVFDGQQQEAVHDPQAKHLQKSREQQLQLQQQKELQIQQKVQHIQKQLEQDQKQRAKEEKKQQLLREKQEQIREKQEQKQQRQQEKLQQQLEKKHQKELQKQHKLEEQQQKFHEKQQQKLEKQQQIKEEELIKKQLKQQQQQHQQHRQSNSQSPPRLPKDLSTSPISPHKKHSSSTLPLNTPIKSLPTNTKGSDPVRRSRSPQTLESREPVTPPRGRLRSPPLPHRASSKVLPPPMGVKTSFNKSNRLIIEGSGGFSESRGPKPLWGRRARRLIKSLVPKRYRGTSTVTSEETCAVDITSLKGTFEGRSTADLDAHTEKLKEIVKQTAKFQEKKLFKMKKFKQARRRFSLSMSMVNLAHDQGNNSDDVSQKTKNKKEKTSITGMRKAISTYDVITSEVEEKDESESEVETRQIMSVPQDVQGRFSDSDVIVMSNKSSTILEQISNGLTREETEDEDSVVRSDFHNFDLPEGHIFAPYQPIYVQGGVAWKHSSVRNAAVQWADHADSQLVTNRPLLLVPSAFSPSPGTDGSSSSTVGETPTDSKKRPKSSQWVHTSSGASSSSQENPHSDEPPPLPSSPPPQVYSTPPQFLATPPGTPISKKRWSLELTPFSTPDDREQSSRERADFAAISYFADDVRLRNTDHLLEEHRNALKNLSRSTPTMTPSGSPKNSSNAGVEGGTTYPLSIIETQPGLNSSTLSGVSHPSISAVGLVIPGNSGLTSSVQTTAGGLGGVTTPSSLAGSTSLPGSVATLPQQPLLTKATKKLLRLFPALPQSELVLNSYSCALVSDILLQGTLFITNNNIAFYSKIFGHVSKLVFSFSQVSDVVKERTAKFIPNAVGLHLTDGRSYVFGSLLSRDATFKLLVRVWRRARDMPESDSEPPSAPHLTGEEDSASGSGGSPQELEDRLQQRAAHSTVAHPPSLPRSSNSPKASRSSNSSSNTNIAADNTGNRIDTSSNPGGSSPTKNAKAKKTSRDEAGRSKQDRVDGGVVSHHHHHHRKKHGDNDEVDGSSSSNSALSNGDSGVTSSSGGTIHYNNIAGSFSGGGGSNTNTIKRGTGLPKRPVMRGSSSGEEADGKGAMGVETNTTALAGVKHSLLQLVAAPRPLVASAACAVMLALLFLSAATLMHRVHRLSAQILPAYQQQHQQPEPFGDGLYEEVLVMQQRLHAAAAAEVEKTLHMQLRHLSTVRQSLDALSLLFSKDPSASPTQGAPPPPLTPFGMPAHNDPRSSLDALTGATHFSQDTQHHHQYQKYQQPQQDHHQHQQQQKNPS